MFFVWPGKLWLGVKGIVAFLATLVLVSVGLGWLWGRHRRGPGHILLWGHPTRSENKNFLHRAGDLWDFFFRRPNV
jgi:hypothetical protein